MQPQQNADTGFKQRQHTFVDTPLLHYIEDEFLPLCHIDAALFFEILSVMVEDVGCAYRRIIGEDEIRTINQYKQISNYRLRIPELRRNTPESVVLNIIPGEMEGIRDQHCCKIPACILDILMTVVSVNHQDKNIIIRARSQQHGGLLNTMLMRCQQLSGIELHNVTVGVIAGNSVVAINTTQQVSVQQEIKQA